MKKAIKIDVKNRNLSTVEINNFNDISTELECKYFEYGGSFKCHNNSYHFYVDGEAWLKKMRSAFYIKGVNNTIPSHAIIFKSVQDDDGSVDNIPELIEYLIGKLTFGDLQDEPHQVFEQHYGLCLD